MISGTIIVRLKGGLGNQLFILASSYAMAKARRSKLIVDAYNGFSNDRKYNRKFITRDLKWYKEADVIWIDKKGFVAWFYKLLCKVISKSRSNWYSAESVDGFDQNLQNKKSVRFQYIDGYLQSYKYFDAMQEEVKYLCSPAFELRSSVSEVLDYLKNNEVVSMHIRKFSIAEESTSNLQIEYYLRALKHINLNTDCSEIFVFSDDTTWAKKILKNIASKKITYVSDRIQLASDLEEFEIMRSCKHFIVANSTFSWWGAWLGQKSDSIVIAPAAKKSTEQGDEGSWGFDHLIPNTWVTM